MKKLLVISLLALLLLSSCGSKNSQNNQTNSERDSDVKLLSMTSEIISSQEKSIQTNKREVRRNNLNYQYVVLDETENEFAITIKLSNPNDYHILDFNLECDDENLQVMIGNSYTDLKPLQAINWKGDTNTLYTMNFKSTSSDFLSSLRMTKLLYIERLDSKISYNADVSTNNEVSIYRVHSVNLELGKYGDYGLKYKIASEDSNIENLQVNNAELNFNEYYETLENLSITYDYNLGDITLNETLTFEYNQNDYIYGNAVWVSQEGSYFEIVTDRIEDDTMLSYTLYKGENIVHQETTINHKVATESGKDTYDKVVVAFNNIELVFNI